MYQIDTNSSILITGGTGSFGKAFLSKLLKVSSKSRRIVIYSRDELKQWELQQRYPMDEFPNLRFFIGDIRDRSRLQRALESIDIVVHAAALKHVPIAEYNPGEFIKTNIIGSENIISACLEKNVKNVIALSTDKAAAPINLYGATKLCADKLFIAANNIKGNNKIKFSIVRYGNVMGSRGSVIPFFLEKAKENYLPITNPQMTRFNITLEESVNIVLDCMGRNIGGEIFVPKLPSYTISDLVEAIGPNCEKKYIGLRPGEKIHEEMITSADSYSTIDIGDKFVILPSDGELLSQYKKMNIKFKDYEKGISYNSGSNQDFLSVEQIRNLIKKNININFQPH